MCWPRVACWSADRCACFRSRPRAILHSVSIGVLAVLLQDSRARAAATQAQGASARLCAGGQ
eukprot:5346740-Alexandrium_andersonii.AAC.1